VSLPEQFHQQFFRIAELIIQIQADLDINLGMFNDAIKQLSDDGPGDDNFFWYNHIGIPAYRLQLDKSGKVINALEPLIQS
jgi:hypothetical protein